MIKVVLLGYGNVNSHLIKVLSNCSDVTVKQIFNRSKVKLDSTFDSIPFTNDIEEIIDADVYIMGISDNAIGTFSESLPLQNKLVVHTSGGVSMDFLSKKNRRGVFYPLQSFSKQRSVDFQKIPICIEAENQEDLELLHKLGSAISDVVTEISSKKRERIHVAAVFVNNFVNYLYQIGEDILSEDGIPFDLLKPLIKETANKIEILSPKEAQTGPAKRSDSKTIEKHLKLLENSPYKEVYTTLTNHLKKQWE